MKNILFFGVWLKFGFLRRGRSFVGMTILGVVVFGMGGLVSYAGVPPLSGWQFWGWLLWNGGLGTYAEVPPSSGWQFWVGGWFGMGDWVLTQRSLLRRDDNFGWVVALDWGGWYLRRGPSFVGMTSFGTYAGGLLCWDDRSGRNDRVWGLFIIRMSKFLNFKDCFKK